MMQYTENFPPSWPFESCLNSAVDHQSYGYPFDGSEYSSEISSISHFFSTEIEEFPAPLEGIDSMLTDGIQDLYKCLDHKGEDSFGSVMPAGSPSASDMTSTSIGSSLTLPGEAVETDNRSSIFHLLKAYGEAVEKNQSELAEVILRCLGEKASPVGEALERVAFHLSRDVIRDRSDYLLQESSKNFDAAYRAFYQVFPYCRFAHFAANSAILEAMPSETDTLHIVDFDVGEGIQWPPVMEVMARKHKSMRLTSIRWGDEESCRFEGTMRHLRDHARSFGLNLKVEEMEFHDLVNELKGMKKRGGSQEWLAFNCTPGIGKCRSRKIVNEFLDVAKDYVSTHKGIITFGDGDACKNPKDCSGFDAFFDDQLMHYQTVLESMESTFTKHLEQARMAMECLFVGPSICGQAWLEKWKAMKETRCSDAGTVLTGLRVSSERLMEAKEIAKERDNLYEVSIGGDFGNELALEWRGITVARVSSWRN